MSTEKNFKNLTPFNYDLLEKDFENLDQPRQKIKNRNVKEKAHQFSENGLKEIVSGDIYDLPYNAFEKEKSIGIKELEMNQFHPMLGFSKFHISHNGKSLNRWSLGTSKINTAILKQKRTADYSGSEGYFFELKANSIDDPVNRRKYPLHETFFIIHPDCFFIYKFNDVPNSRAYRGNIGIEKMSLINDNFIRIENEVSNAEV